MMIINLLIVDYMKLAYIAYKMRFNINLKINISIFEKIQLQLIL